MAAIPGKTCSEQTFSLSVSRAEVASSSRRILGFLTSARAIATRCFWPPLNCVPLSPTFVSYFYHTSSSLHQQQISVAAAIKTLEGLTTVSQNTTCSTAKIDEVNMSGINFLISVTNQFKRHVLTGNIYSKHLFHDFAHSQALNKFHFY